MSNETFFIKVKEPSKVKAQIVSKYFEAWANIICNTIQKNKIKRPSIEEVIGYVDLFAGQGRYDDGTMSTPLLILDKASKNIVHRRMLKTLFNDAESEHISKLKSEIEKLDSYEKLLHKPVFCTENLAESSERIIKMLSKPNLPPMILFADPWGYKGLTLDLFSKVIKHWGCEVIFFFNYNRINAALDNPCLFENMKELFGYQRALELGTLLHKKKPREREEVIMDAVKKAMSEIGGAFTLEFKFSKGKRTSHHLIFVTKDKKGFGLMKSIMAKVSDRLEAHIKSSLTRFSFNAFKPNETNSQLALFDNNVLVACKLGGELLKVFAGKTMTMYDIYLNHHVGNHYIESDYKNAIRHLEEVRAVTTNPTAEKRQIRNGIRTVSDKLLISFPDAK
ncbi:three-Cys-motif partner protein TcmP [Rufibacter immobilis]|uniref:three-Cys-motif partner protein TcmP n=1 Tax=Rufibacter immobilis TaxID=1348778 RepID=UPI0035E98792